MTKRKAPKYGSQISILEKYMENYKLKTKSVKEKIKYYKEKLQNNYWDLINLIAYKIELLGEKVKILVNEEEKMKIKKQIDNLKEKIKIEGN